LFQSNLSPVVLCDFLRSLGWELLEAGLYDQLYVMRHPDFPRRQLVFPMDTSAPDYPETVDLIFEKLGEMLNKCPYSLLRHVI